jgi:glycerol-3-phosphate dehydrogenase (NAD(P)+)
MPRAPDGRPLRFETIAVVGAGAWGTALANVAMRAGRHVKLVARNERAAAVIRASGESPHLPGVKIDPRIAIAAGAESLRTADMVLLVVPAQVLRAAARELNAAIRPGTPVIACAKGIERKTRAFMTDVITACLPQAEPAILSGPSFATDVSRGLPTAVTLAARDAALAEALVQALGTHTFRPYHSTDLRGVEIGGAAKNVLAIAAGIVRGRALGASAAAALTTRGFAELIRFGRAFGARMETLTGLSGLGDLILTCSTRQSRNFSLGIAIGEGMAPAQACAAMLAEGAFTASVLVEMAHEAGVDMPIATAVDAVLDGRLSVDAAMEGLLARPFKAES